MVGKFVYWLAVVAISLALVVALILFFESRDDSSLEGAAVPAPVAAHGRLTSLAKTTIRCAALYSGWQAVSTSRS